MSLAHCSAVQLLTQYARYHRDPRNIVTHFVGIPMIVFAVGVLAGRAHGTLAGLPFNAAWLLWALSTLWYFRQGHAGLALATSAGVAALVAAGQGLTGGSTAVWLAWGLGTFVVGWAWQFAGHFWEGRKPAFVDDVRGLLVGPMFVVAELGFMRGAWRDVKAEIEAGAGPVQRRDLLAR